MKFTCPLLATMAVAVSGESSLLLFVASASEHSLTTNRHCPSGCELDPHQGVQPGAFLSFAGDMHRVERYSSLGPPQALGHAHHLGMHHHQAVRDWPSLANRHL
jgi:hypothetical protein